MNEIAFVKRKTKDGRKVLMNLPYITRIEEPETKKGSTVFMADGYSNECWQTVDEWQDLIMQYLEARNAE